MNYQDSWLTIDFETVPDESMPEELFPKPKMGNLTDPKKIEKKQKEWDEEGLSKALSIDPLINKIVYIGMWSSIAKDYVTPKYLEPEEEQIDRFWKEVKQHELIVGKNHIGFDLPAIIVRSMILGIKTTRTFNFKKYSNYPLYDIQGVLSGYDLSKAKTLDWLAQRFGFEFDNTPGSAIYGFHKEGKDSAIINHCRKDVKVTNKIFEKIEEYYPVNEPKGKHINEY